MYVCAHASACMCAYALSFSFFFISFHLFPSLRFPILGASRRVCPAPIGCTHAPSRTVCDASYPIHSGRKHVSSPQPTTMCIPRAAANRGRQHMESDSD